MSGLSQFFSYFPDFCSLEGEVRLHRYSPGEFICREEDRLSRLFFLLSGKARVYRSLANGRTYLFQIYGAGDIVGDIEYFLDIPASCTVRAGGALEAASVRMDALENATESVPNYCRILARGLARKLHRESLFSSQNVSYPLRVRLAGLLLSGGLSGYGRGGMEECANQLGTSVRHLRRTLGELETRGLIRRRENQLLITDRVGLKLLAGDLDSP